MDSWRVGEFGEVTRVLCLNLRCRPRRRASLLKCALVIVRRVDEQGARESFATTNAGTRL